MKRRRTSGLAWLVSALVFAAARLQAQSEVCTVAAVGGTLQVQRAGAWQNATVGVPLFVSDRLRTGATDSGKIVCRDDSVLDVAPNTELTLDKQIFDAGARRFETLLRIVKGKVRAWVSEYYKQPRARYEVETPTAIAGVRGTEFIMLYDASGEATEVVGLDGTVDVAGKLAVLGSSVQVGPRFLSRVEKGRFPTPPQPLDDARLRQYLSGLGIIGTGRRDGLNVQHAATAGRLLAPQDLPSEAAKQGHGRGRRVGAPQGFLAERLSPDLATNTQPLLGFRSSPPGRVPSGGVRVGF